MSYIIKTTLFLLEGSLVTLQLYAITAILSVPIGIICALGKTSKSRVLKNILEIYTWLFRGTPLLLQIFFVYYGLPTLGFPPLPRFLAASITFVLNYAAYLTEIYRAGIESIDKGQYEAAKALGMTYPQTMVRIIIPQTIKRVLPPTANEAINLVKDSALVTVIAMPDLLRNAKVVVTRDFTIMPFIIAAIFYLIFTSVVVFVFRKLEKKYSIYE
ncbi:MAG: amino acid ABC transporter permease [Clostridia bacterium]|nr:amino acid ABC transporter permease [Clostridia bacterium]